MTACLITHDEGRGWTRWGARARLWGDEERDEKGSQRGEGGEEEGDMPVVRVWKPRESLEGDVVMRKGDEAAGERRGGGSVRRRNRIPPEGI